MRWDPVHEGGVLFDGSRSATSIFIGIYGMYVVGRLAELRVGK